MFHWDNNFSLNNTKYNRFYRNSEYSGFVNGYNQAIYEKCYQLGYELGKQNKEPFSIPDFFKKLNEIETEEKQTNEKEDELSYSDSEISNLEDQEPFSPLWKKNNFYECLNSPIEKTSPSTPKIGNSKIYPQAFPPLPKTNDKMYCDYMSDKLEL